MPNSERVNEALLRIDHLERRGQRVQWFLLTLMAVIVVLPVVATLWVNHQYNLINDINMTDIRIVGTPYLCPGDKLIIEFNLHIEGDGVLNFDSTTRTVDPPRTIIFSDPGRFIMDGPIDQNFRIGWTIPPTYHEFEIDQPVPFLPGEYAHRFSISAPEGTRVFDSGEVRFTIKSDCPVREELP